MIGSRPLAVPPPRQAQMITWPISSSIRSIFGPATSAASRTASVRPALPAPLKLSLPISSEVTRGGMSTRQFSSVSMAMNRQPVASTPLLAWATMALAREPRAMIANCLLLSME